MPCERPDNSNEQLSIAARMCGGVIGVDLAGLLGGRMASAEGGSVSSGVAYGEGCPLSSQLRGLVERRELHQRDPGQSPGRKRILAYFEGHKMLIFVPIRQNLRGGGNLH